jgi:hypothetical protein
MYVVKMFSPKQVQQQNAVAKEFFGNVLAKEMGLPVPKMAMIRLEKPFLESLPVRYKEIEQKSQRGLRFGCSYAPDFVIFDDALSQSKLNVNDMANVFAFDNFVYNLDRGGFRKKPNLLVRDGSFLLIDHEQIFPFADDPDVYNDSPIRAFLQENWAYPWHVHLFYPYLRALDISIRKMLFRPFLERLSRFDPFILEEPTHFLTEHAQPVGNIELIQDYLQTLQRDPERFGALLQKQFL